ncbi:NAD-dependent epimerase/dehydratase family protein [Fundidesulfovibrio agrisoli]|uniref:NAD-dependent epimerase/dehydratase family protein n=1 Tax=Fundidesulfovibrio agrisoli TaxID=2922717 RepID=UPI001FAC34CF
MIAAGTGVVVTGGAGFIGSHLVDALLGVGCRVLVIDDFSSGERANLAHHAGNPGLTVAEADIRDEAAMLRLLKGQKLVFHLACRNVRLSLKRPTEVHEVNATGTLNLLKAAAANRVRRFLYTSSSEVNGTADVIPMPEDYHFKPETVYGASKLTGEYYTQVFQRAGWLETVIARPHNNYGPREHYFGHKGEVIPRFILWAMAGMPPIIFGDGLQTRDFTYVTETASFLVRLMASERAAGQTVNVCRGDEVSIRQIAEMVATLSGRDLAPQHVQGRPSDVLRLFGDNSRLKDILGDTPGISISEGLARTYNWFAANVEPTPEVLESMKPMNWAQAQAEEWLSAWEAG